MCEGNSGQLVPAVDQAIELLSRARDSLASHNSVAELVEAGHAARGRVTHSFPRSDIFAIVSAPRTRRAELAAAGRAGGSDQIRSANPG